MDNIKITDSLAGLMPCIGLQLHTTNDLGKYMSQVFHLFTNDIGKKQKRCPNCGLLFTTGGYNSPKEQIFCSTNCSNKYRARLINENNKKTAFKIVNKKAFADWFKIYNNRVIGYIYNNFESEFREDLIDIWTDKAVIWYAKMFRKDHPWKFIKANLSFAARTIRQTKKEFFYDECSIKVQQHILGECNYE